MINEERQEKEKISHSRYNDNLVGEMMQLGKLINKHEIKESYLSTILKKKTNKSEKEQ